MKSTFFARRSLLILAVVLFLLPFCVRGARMSARHMKNDVKDWLPSGFKETRQLEWFRDHFLGEQFVIISWAGCREGDPRLELLTRKLTPLSPDEGEGEAPAALPSDQPARLDGSLALPSELPSVRRLGLRPEARYANWGGREEKWLQADDGRWYFILPNGVLHAWELESRDHGLRSWRDQWSRFFNKRTEGRQIAVFSPRFYQNPWLLAAPLFKTVTTGPQLLARLTSEEEGGAGLSRAEALRRLQGVLFGPDGEQTCLIVTLTERAKLNLHRVVGRGILGKPRGRIYTLAEQCGIEESELRLGGPPVDNVAIDEEGSRTLVRLVGLSVLLGVGLAYACFRSIKATMIVFSIGAIAAVMSLSLVWWCGSRVDAVLMSMPSLVYVLGISGAVHIINHYRAAVEESGYVGASEKALAHGWKPALLCSVTTALGLASLCTSQIVPIAKFGFFSALAVLATIALLFTYLPAVLHLWPLPLRGGSSGERSWLDRHLASFWERLGSWIIRRYALVGAGCVLLTVAVGYGVARMQTSVQLIKMFDSRAKIIQDYRWLETNIGELVPMELVVRVEPDMMRSAVSDQPSASGGRKPPETPGADAQSNRADALVRLTFLERMELTHRVEEVIQRQFGPEGSDVVGPSMSAATFAPPLPEIGGGFAAFARRGGTNRRLEAHRDELLHSDYLRVDEKTGAELWRISLRLGAFNDVDYGQFVDTLQAAVEPVIDAYAQRAKILRQLIAARGGRAPAGARVLLIGESDARGGDPAEARRRAAFAKTLYELLTVARLEISAYDAAAVEKLVASGAADFDCVILLDGVPSAARTGAARLAPLVIDAAPPAAQLASGGRPLVASGGRQPPEKRAISMVYTGVVPLVYKAQRTLLEGLVQSTFWSFVTITPLLMFVARSFWAGLVAMIPNTVPVLLIFGGMGWLGIEVDIGSMMTASIALGVAVDDTIHFLTWYREALRDAPDRRTAILKAYQCCATPTFQSAVISGLGLSIFAFSTFTPTQRFGYLMLSILAMGMFAELIFFPALLASPLGRVFKPAKAPHVPQTPPEEVRSAERGVRNVPVRTPHSTLRTPHLREKQAP